MTMKAIETKYKGYRFRSRLEARWAVFFDTLGIEWEYEKEGYDLGEAGWYLPDFWLPEQKCWVEIKGQYPDKKEIAKIGKLWTPDAVAYCAIGQPYIEKKLSIVSSYEIYPVDDRGVHESNHAFILCPSCNNVDVVSINNERYYCNGCDLGPRPVPVAYGLSFWKGDVIIEDKSSDPRISPFMILAYKAARSARFEYGECGL